MKISAMVLTVRSLPDEVLRHAKVIKDLDEMCCVVYSSDLVSEEQLVTWILDYYGPDWAQNDLACGIWGRYKRDGNFFLHRRAGKLPCIGQQQVLVENVELELS